MYNENDDARYNGTFKTVWLCNRAGSYKKKVGTTDIDIALKVGDTAIVATKYEVSDDIDRTRKYLVIDDSKMYKADGSANGNKLL